MNFPEDVPNSSQSFMNFLTKCIVSSRLVLIHCLFTHFESSYLFLQQYPFLQFCCNLNYILNKAATPDSSLLVYALIFSCIVVLGIKQIW